MYFKNFDTVYYDFEINGERRIIAVVDILKNVRFKKELLSNITIYDEYDIRDSESIEIIAEKVYGNPNYHWIIMLVNEKYDYVDDFPLSTYEFELALTAKYGAGNEYDLHHYEDENGFVVDSSYANKYEVSNYEYETRVNESKRRIKLVSKELIDTILKNFREL